MKLKVVNAPQALGSLQFIGDHAPLAHGHGIDQFHCGDCDEILLAHMSPMDIRGKAFRCPTCGSWNELAPDDSGPAAA